MRASAFEQGEKMSFDKETQLKEIKEIFADAAREEGWEVEGEMLYSYYFVDTSIEKLEKLGLQLEKEDYDFINIFELGDDETGEPTGEYLLHLDKTEKNTPETLIDKIEQFEKLAVEYEIDSFDGWEFGEEGDYEDLDEDEVLDDDKIEE